MKFILILLLALFSCNQKLIQIESDKVYEGCPDRPPVIIKTKYENGREIERKITYQSVKLLKHEVDTTPTMPNIVILFKKKL